MKAASILAAVVLISVAITKARLMESNADIENVTATAIAPVAIPSSLPQSDEAGSEVKLVLLTLLPEGFDSRELRLDPGQYLFIVGNRTGVREVNVRIDRVGGERITSAKADGRPRDWKKRVTLATGTYVVIANHNPTWTCRIVVGQ